MIICRFVFDYKIMFTIELFFILAVFFTWSLEKLLMQEVGLIESLKNNIIKDFTSFNSGKFRKLSPQKSLVNCTTNALVIRSVFRF